LVKDNKEGSTNFDVDCHVKSLAENELF